MTKLPRILQSILVSYAVVQMYLQEAWGLRCLLCTAGEPSFFCNSTSNRITCLQGQTSCITKVQYDDKAGFLSTKGCSTPQSCLAEGGNAPGCALGVVKGSCTWCCSGDNCNNDKYTYSSTIPTPTVLPTRDPKTWLSTLAPPSCHVGELRKCITEWEDDVKGMLTEPRQNFPTFCRNIPDIIHCLVVSLGDCVKEQAQSGSTSQILNQVLESMWLQCPHECNQTGGWQCVQTSLNNMIHLIYYNQSECMLLQREFHLMQNCLAQQTGSCDAPIRDVYTLATDLLSNEVDFRCDNPDKEHISGPPYDYRCKVEEALQKIHELAYRTLRVLVQKRKGQLDLICNTLLDSTRAEVEELTKECTNDVQTNIQAAFKVVGNLLSLACDTPTIPPVCNTTMARECIVNFFRLIDDADEFGKVCDGIEISRQCVEQNTAACPEADRINLNETLETFIRRVEDRCQDMVTPTDPCTKKLTLVEGGPEVSLGFKIVRPPKDLCGTDDDCKVFVDVVETLGEQPKCKDGSTIPQTVVKKVTGDKNSSCSREVTNENWQGIKGFVLAAKIDGKYDHDQERELFLVLKIVTGGKVFVRVICRYKITVIDTDKGSMCQSNDDPHMVTFDGIYYNNYLHGQFVLYRNKVLPYEVQTIFQRCNRVATCNCAVAVKSGDFVFVVENCLKKPSICSSGRRGVQCRSMIRTYAYAWDDHVTEGTRVFVTDAGKQYKIVLPHGTVIKIKIKGNTIPNVWIVPSPYDWQNTEGLCGVYDGDKSNDFTLRDGTIVRGVKHKSQPNGFNKSWRIMDKTESIFNGVAYHPYLPPSYCDCLPEGHKDRDTCEHNALVETCNLKKAGEIDFSNVPVEQPTEKHLQRGDLDIPPVVQSRQARDVASQSDAGDLWESVELDLQYEPGEIKPAAGWTEETATDFCENFIQKKQLWSQMCARVPDVSVTFNMYNCVEDILITGDTSWAYAALDAYQEQCTGEMERNEDFTNSFEGQTLEREITSQLCPGHCSGKGACRQGECICQSGWSGEDCSEEAGVAPSELIMAWDGLCNTRRSHCTSAAMYGRHFVHTDKLTCHLTKVQITKTKVKKLTTIKQKAIFYTSSQVLCKLPTRDAYIVDISNDGVSTSGKPQLHIPYDPNCFTCHIDYGNPYASKCIRKPDSCIIKGRCYAKHELSEKTPCLYCDPKSSDNSWTVHPACRKSNGLGVGIAIFIILVMISVAVVIFICWRKRKQENTNAPPTNEIDSVAIYQQAESQHKGKPCSEKSSFENQTYGEPTAPPSYEASEEAHKGVKLTVR